MTEYRIDDLARAAGTTVRSLRVLHDRGLLPPAELRGRTGYYDDTHLARVRTVLRMQERGFTLAAIGELVTAWENGRDLTDVLGFESAITRPWSDRPPPVEATRQELHERLGVELADADVARLVATGLLRADGDGYLLLNAFLLDAGAEMLAMGIPVETMLGLSERLKADQRRTADWLTELVGPFFTADTPDGLPEGELKTLVEQVERIRALARESVGEYFAIAMDESLADYLARISQWARSSTEAPVE